MLDDLDRTLRTLLTDEMPQVAERIEADAFDITFDVPNREFAGRLSRPTLNLYLYSIQEDRERGRSPWITGRLNGVGVRERPPVRLECSYMVTAWSNQVEDEHRLLTAAARVFFRNPVIPAGVLQGDLPDEIEISADVAQPAAIRDVADIWSVLDNDLKPSVRITFTVPLELEVSSEAPLTRSREIRMPPPFGDLSRGGIVRVEGRALRGDRPVAGADVKIDGSSSSTRDDGTFELRAVRPGRRTALVAVGGDFMEFPVDVPRDGKLDLQLPAADGGAD